MKAFAALYGTLDQSTRTSDKVAALAAYLSTAPEADRLWCIALFTGRRPKRAVSTRLLRAWAAEAAGLPDWLFEESYAVAGDLAETIALCLPPPARAEERSLADWIALIRRLPRLPEDRRRAEVLAAWDALDGTARFLFTKLLTGGFRVGVSRRLTTRALARATGQDEAAMALRLMGDWDPAGIGWAELLGGGGGDLARPYPFHLANPLDDPAEVADPALWFAEWKWDGIRGQAVRRGTGFALWSRGEDLVTDRFPDLAPLADHLPPGTVLDGEILAWDAAAGRPLPFARLQTRIARKAVTKSVLAAAPVRFLAYDLLEAGGTDIRPAPFADRRARLAALLAALPPGLPLGLSPEAPFADAASLAARRDEAAAMGAEGLMVKRRAGPYGIGRKAGEWWKWKRAPLTVDAVMIYAQAGHGRRANLFTDFTFAVRDGAALVPFAKAYSGLTDAEFAEITAWVRRHTLQRFGPVRQVPPELVFELAFEGIQESPRHRSGLALRFPRILRWRRDKPASEIDTIETLRALLPRST